MLLDERSVESAAAASNDPDQRTAMDTMGFLPFEAWPGQGPSIGKLLQQSYNLCLVADRKSGLRCPDPYLHRERGGR